MDNDPCTVCRSRGAKTGPTTGDSIQQTCQRCGQFILFGSAIGRVHGLRSADQAKLSAMIRQANNMGSVPRISDHVLSVFLASPMPSLFERANILILALYKEHPKLGARFSLVPIAPRLYAETFSESEDEIKYIFRFIGGDGEKLVRTVADNQMEFTSEGHRRIFDLQKVRTDSSQAFVAMWFGGKDKRGEMDAVWAQGLALGISHAGYKPHRVDKGEYNGRIDDEIIRQIRRSRFLVADFTQHVAGVYYETGFAEGLGLPIIQTCKAGEVDKLHFDNRQINTIAWTTANDLAERLQKRIESTLGRGPIVA